MTKLASVVAAALLVTVATATPAHAWTDGPAAVPAWTPLCEDGQRDTATQWAAIGDFTAPRQVTWAGGSRVELHYNGESRCAWGSYTGAKPAVLYVDRSSDGGAHWEGPLGSRGPGESAYTGVYNDSSPYVTRACAGSQGHLHCTDWY
jgi:hypothetical protein